MSGVTAVSIYPHVADVDNSYSLVIGFVLSIIGTALLYLGQLGSFAGVSSYISPFRAFLRTHG